MRKAASFSLAALGCAWPFAAHWLAMTRFYPALSRPPGRWAAYAALAALPCPILLFCGLRLLARDAMPYPANVVVPAVGTAALVAVVAGVFFVAIGLVGVTLPF